MAGRAATGLAAAATTGLPPAGDLPATDTAGLAGEDGLAVVVTGLAGGLPLAATAGADFTAARATAGAAFWAFTGNLTAGRFGRAAAAPFPATVFFVDAGLPTVPRAPFGWTSAAAPRPAGRMLPAVTNAGRGAARPRCTSGGWPQSSRPAFSAPVLERRDAKCRVLLGYPIRPGFVKIRRLTPAAASLDFSRPVPGRPALADAAGTAFLCSLGSRGSARRPGTRQTLSGRAD
jgi:hypothetical protein